MKLHQKLKELDRYPFHMPGHKRNAAFGIVGSDIDITETDGFDNLHDARGVILETENALSKIYRSKRSFMLVNGSTVGLLAAVFAVCSEGDKIIVAKNCHKSVYNACLLRKLRVVYLEPEFDSINLCYTDVMQDKLDSALLSNPDAAAVVITSPTYEGRISNVKCSLPLIVDAAHGAHLGLGSFPSYPKGSIVISSLHKTLPALTQTAVANVYDEKYIQPLKRYIDIFETSSPSYVLMNSVSLCCEAAQNEKLFSSLYKTLCDFREIKLNALKLKYSDDISKLVISTENTDISGAQLADILRNKYKIEPEMASLNYIVLMTSVGDTKEGFGRLKAALTEIDSNLEITQQKVFRKPPVPQGEQMLCYAENTQPCNLKQSVGKTCAEFVFAYPPDIPLLCPGEVITAEAADCIFALISNGVNVVSDSQLLPDEILTKAE